MLIYWKTKDFKQLQNLKLKIRFFKEFLSHLYFLFKAETSIKVFLCFIITYLKKIKNEDKFIDEIYLNSKINSYDWFSMKIPILKFYLDKCKFPPSINGLEIGSYEGKSAIFFMKYFDKIKLTCVDTWEGTDEQDSETDFKKIENNFEFNMSGFKENVIKFKGRSDNFFKLNKDKNFDFIYIDGYHIYETVLDDANSSFKLLNKGGIILFDDFLWGYYKKNIKLNPIFAINTFLKNHKNNIEIIYASSQLMIKKSDI